MAEVEGRAASWSQVVVAIVLAPAEVQCLVALRQSDSIPQAVASPRLFLPYLLRLAWEVLRGLFLAW